jgi:hypothetical protein
MFVCPECGTTAPTQIRCPQDGVRLVDGRQDPMLGTTAGAYRIASVLGRGGMGCVYRAVHPTTGGRAAIKVITAPGNDTKAVERFFAEARTLGLLHDDHIVKVLDLGWLPDGRPFIVMEYVDGVVLSSWLTSPAGLGARQLVGIGIEILDALVAAHTRGIVHRDLKPDNVMVTPAGHAKVLDFGIAKLRRDGEPTYGLTATGAILGTPLYMSPEQALARPADARSDLYSFGIILYQGLTGRLPFSGTTLFELLRHQIQTPPAPLRGLRPDLPESVEQLVLRTLAKDPNERPQSAAELRAWLGQVGSSLPDRPPALVAGPGAAPSGAASVSVSPSVGMGPQRSERSRGVNSAVWAVAAGFGALALLVSVLLLAGAGLLVWQSLGSSKSSVAAPLVPVAEEQVETATPAARVGADPGAGEGSARAAPSIPADAPSPSRPRSPTERPLPVSAASPKPPNESPPSSDGTITVTESSPRKVSVWIGSSAVTRGTYDGGALASGVARGYGPVRACYVGILETHDGAAGTLNMRMSITPEGKTRAVGWLGTSSHIPTNLGTCINRAYLALAFPSHAGPSSVEVTFQIRLSTSE